MTNWRYDISTGFRLVPGSLLSVPINPTVLYSIKNQGWGTHYNIHTCCKSINGKIDVGVLESAVNHVINMHDGLRLRLHEQSGVYSQWLSTEDAGFEFETIDLSAVADANQLQLMQEISALLQKEFVFDKSRPLYRVIHFKLSSGNASYILFIFHHFIIDGYSLLVFMDEVVRVYKGLMRGDYNPDSGSRPSVIEWLYGLADEQQQSLKKNVSYWSAIDWSKVCEFNYEAEPCLSEAKVCSAAGNKEEIAGLFGYGAGFVSGGTYYGHIMSTNMAECLFQLQDSDQSSIVFELLVLSLYEALQPYLSGDIFALETVAANRHFSPLSIGNFVTHNILLVDFSTSGSLSLPEKITLVKQAINSIPLKGRGLLEVMYGNHSSWPGPVDNVKLPGIGLNMMVHEEMSDSFFGHDADICWGARDSRNSDNPNIKPLFFHILKHKAGLAGHIVYREKFLEKNIVENIHNRFSRRLNEYTGLLYEYYC